MTDDIAIRVENLGKMYRIYDQPADRLKQMLWGRHLAQGYGREFWALKNFSCTVRRGEMLGVIGRNGSGKSTLLQMLAGTLSPTTGSVQYTGRVSALLELGSGFNPDYSGRDNVFIAGAILGISAAEMRQRFDAIVDFAGIGDFLEQPVKTYSSGMGVRLAFAVASCVDPDILIVDEALSVGDMVFQQRCFRRFQEIRSTGTTVVFVSHDLGSVIRFCDQALVLQQGGLVAAGSPKEMADFYKKSLAEELISDQESQLAQPIAEPSSAILLSRTHFERNPNCQEYGDGALSIADWGLFDDLGNPVTTIGGDQPITVFMRIRCNRSCMAPIAAFTIRDLKGNEIAGTNTQNEGHDIGPVQPGMHFVICFRQPLPLAVGSYALSLGCTEFVDAGLAVHHRLYDVFIFQSAPSRRFLGVFDLRTNITVTLEKS